MLASLAWLRLACGQASRKKRIDEFAPLTLKSIALRALVHARFRSRPIQLAALRHALHPLRPLQHLLAALRHALRIGNSTRCVMLTQHNVVPLDYLGRWAERCSLTHATVAPLLDVAPAVPLNSLGASHSIGHMLGDFVC